MMGRSLCAMVLAALPAWGQPLDPFDDDPVGSADWELYEPLPGVASYSADANPGHWRVTAPAHEALDQWLAIDHALRLRRRDMGASFAIEARLCIASDRHDTFNAGLYLDYGRYDVLFWGFSYGGGLELVRTGHGNLAYVPGAPECVSLRIERERFAYRFSWKAEEGDAWIPAGTRTVMDPPEAVGLFVKTWGDPPWDIVVDFDAFDMTEPAPVAPEIAQVAPDPLPFFAGGTFRRVLDLVRGYPPPAWELLAGPPGMVLTDDGILEDWAPGFDEVGRTYSVRVRATNGEGAHEVDFALEVAGEILEEFEGDALGPAWIFRAPQAGATWSLTDAPGSVRIRLPDTGAGGPNFDQWGGADWSFDRMARLVRQDMGSGDFTIETEARLVATGPFLHAGLVVELEDPGTDVVIWGWFDNTGTPVLLANRTGDRSPFSPAVTPSSGAVGLRLERRGGTFRFLWRESLADPWRLHYTMGGIDEPVAAVGLGAKNWASTTAVTLDCEIFRLSAGVWPPVLEPLEDHVAFVGIPYCRRVAIRMGYPEPELELLQGPPGMTVDADGAVRWAPTAADVGGTFPVEVRATNEAGSDTVSWTVSVLAAFEDEFEGAELDPAWEWHLPLEGAELRLDDPAGFATIVLPGAGLDGQTFDHWIGFDRTPKLRLPVDTCGDFAIETRLELVSAIPEQYLHTGLYVGLRSPEGDPDSIIYGFFDFDASRRPWIAAERTGHRSPPSADAFIDGDEVSLRIERKGTRLEFLFREDDAEAWTFLDAMEVPDRDVAWVGICAKNWNPSTLLEAAFDRFRYEALEPAPPVLEVGCAGEEEAYAGEPYLVPVTVRPGYPHPDAIETSLLEGPEGMAIGPDGVLAWTPPDGAVGLRVPVTVRATNGAGSVERSWTIAVARRAPILDPFDGDDLDPDWELHEGTGGWIYDVADGRLHVSLPVGLAFDHWVEPDGAVQLRRPAPPGDWVIETRIALDPATAAAPGARHLALMVYFDVHDILAWGSYGLFSPAGLVGERTGRGLLVDLRDVDAADVELAIRKTCDLYSLWHRPAGEADWRFAGELRVTSEPLEVGLFFKKWDANAVADFAVDFFDIRRGEAEMRPRFVRGDADGNGTFTIGDGIGILGLLFDSSVHRLLSDCDDAGDLDDNGQLTIGDAVYLFNFLFGGGPAPSGQPVSPAGPEQCIEDATPSAAMRPCRYPISSCP